MNIIIMLNNLNVRLQTQVVFQSVYAHFTRKYKLYNINQQTCLENGLSEASYDIIIFSI